MKTVIELDNDGSRTVFHRTDTGAWTHPDGHPVRMETTRESPRVPVEMPCPACAVTSKRGRPRRTSDQDLDRARKARERMRQRRQTA
jgi:hypothetical protein